MPKTTLKDNLRFIDIADVKEYSCQEKSDIDKNYIQKGNKIAAIIISNVKILKHICN